MLDVKEMRPAAGLRQADQSARADALTDASISLSDSIDKTNRPSALGRANSDATASEDEWVIEGLLRRGDILEVDIYDL